MSCSHACHAAMHVMQPCSHAAMQPCMSCSHAAIQPCSRHYRDHYHCQASHLTFLIRCICGFVAVFRVDKPAFLDGDFMSNRATQILPHHRYVYSLGAPLACVQGTISKVFDSPENHHGANHQHFIIKID